MEDFPSFAPSGNLRPVPELEAAPPECARVECFHDEGAPHLEVFSVPSQHEMDAILNMEIALFINGAAHVETTKRVQIIPQCKPSLLIVDRRCLFAFDQLRMETLHTDGGERTISMPLRAQQTVGKKCPCCGKTVTESASQQ